MGPRHALLALALFAACRPAEPSPLQHQQPTVAIDAEASPTFREGEAARVDQRAKCVLRSKAWRHREVRLHHPKIRWFASVTRGDATLRVAGEEDFGRLTIDAEGWRITGNVELEHLDVFAKEPIWLAGAVYPYAHTPLRIFVGKQTLGLTARLELRRHHLVGRLGNDLTVVDEATGCGAISLRPTGYKYPEHIEDIVFADQTQWKTKHGTRLHLGPRQGDPIAEMFIDGEEYVTELARDKGRCWIKMNIRGAALVGWTDCTSLQAFVTRRLGRSHRARPPIIRPDYVASVRIRCRSDLPLQAKQDGHRVVVGLIQPNVTIIAPTEHDDFYAVTPPYSMRSGPSTLLVVDKKEVAKRCEVLPP